MASTSGVMKARLRQDRDPLGGVVGGSRAIPYCVAPFRFPSAVLFTLPCAFSIAAPVEVGFDAP